MKESLNPKTALRLTVSIIGVMVLFGLTWLFGALTVTVQGVRLPFQFLFAFFASFQGFFIFVFFNVLSKEIRDLWKEALCCGRYTPTQKTKTSNAVTKRHHKTNDVSYGITNNVSISISEKDVARR
jgi:hypothetical protein